jgi:peptide/nickel transport system substrate-binding protein
MFLLGLRSFAAAVSCPRVVQTSAGAPGGAIVVAQRSEAKTLNPLLAMDEPSRQVISQLNADLIHVNQLTQRPQAALAESWTVSPDGRHYVLHLRPGVRFSDGVPFDAGDVLFSFQVYLDERFHSPQRDLLTVNGQPIVAKQLDRYTVTLDLAGPYANAERLLDEIAMLPRHLLAGPYASGQLENKWGVNTAPGEIAGLGPFRLKRYQAGQQLELERNPYYWEQDQRGQRLPYLDRLIFLAAGSEDGEVARFLAGDADVIDRLGPASFRALHNWPQGRAGQLVDLGPGLDYTFLAFNFDLPLFRDLALRRAVSLSIDRDAVARIAYAGFATPLAGSVTPGNAFWRNTELQAPKHSPEQAKEILRNAGYRWDSEGKLLDRSGQPVRFSMITAANNKERLETATLIQFDLTRIGIDAQVVPLEFRALVDRVTRTRKFEACMLSLGGGDGDPNSEMNVWLSSGSMHVWSPGQKTPATAWEAEIDTLMKRQMSMLDETKRKQTYDRVQAIVAQEQPVVFLVSPHILAAADAKVVNFRPAILESHTLWNSDILAVNKLAVNKLPGGAH